MLTEIDKVILEEVAFLTPYGWQKGVWCLEHGIVTAIKDHVMDYEDACAYAITKFSARPAGLNYWINQVEGTKGIIYIDNVS